jgi:hypothetical protein
MAAKKLDDVVFPNVQPPPMAMQLQNLGGASAIVVGAFCEHNDQVHSLADLLAAKAGPGTETETGLDNKSAVAFEKHRIRLRMAAGAWRDYHEPIHARLPFAHSRSCPGGNALAGLASSSAYNRCFFGIIRYIRRTSVGNPTDCDALVAGL